MTSYVSTGQSPRSGTDPFTTTTEKSSSIGERLVWLGPAGIVVGLLLTAGAWLQLRGDENHASVAAAATALLLTLPVVVARRFPVTAISIAAGAAVLNGLLFGDLVRCGAAFPAALYLCFAVGARAREGGRSWAWSFAGLAIGIGALFAQFRWDSALNADNTFLVMGPGLAALVWGAGVGYTALRGRQQR